MICQTVTALITFIQIDQLLLLMFLILSNGIVEVTVMQMVEDNTYVKLEKPITEHTIQLYQMNERHIFTCYYWFLYHLSVSRNWSYGRRSNSRSIW